MARSLEKRSDTPDPITGGFIKPVAGRQVILGDVAGERLPQEGWITAAGPKVLSVRTHPPFALSERLFVEFPVSVSDEQHRTVIVRGEVSAVHEAGDVGILDIRWHLMPDAVTSATKPPLTREEAALLVAKTQEDLQKASEAGRLPLVDLKPVSIMRDSRYTPPRGWRTRRYAILAAACLCAVLLLVFFFTPNSRPRLFFGDMRGLEGLQVPALADGTSPSEDGSFPGIALRNARMTPHAASSSLETGRYVWRPGDWVRVDESAVLDAPLEETAPPEPGLLFSPAGWVLAALRPLRSNSEDGPSAPQALGFVVSEMLATADQAADPHQSEPAETGQASVASAQAMIDAPQRFSQTAVEEALGASDLLKLPDQTADQTDSSSLPMNNAPDLITITVSKGEHTLTIEFDGEVAAQFPVGLGQGNATPEGEFAIANKITDPDWFDRGRVVKAGDPENPLGKRWMGLGAEGRATSYGIHPTSEPESIGANMSRGCIRMRPEDAETVFRLCPVGTVVCIKP